MRPVELVRAQLEARNLTTRGPDHKFEAQCPAHEDRNPSLAVTEGAEGRALITCFAGCEPAVIVAALGLEWGDLFEPERSERYSTPRSEPEASYTYTDAAGTAVYQVVRFPEKRFRQRRRAGTDWEWTMEGVKRVLYHLPEVLAAKAAGRWVFLTEGEKDADAVRATGQCATTMPGGAGKWTKDYTAALAGANVVILADDDGPGRAHAVAVYRELYGHCNKVGVRLPAEGCNDIADHLQAGHSLNGGLRKPPEMLDVAPPPASSGRTALTARVFAARKIRDRSLLGPLFQRGMRTVVGAQTGEGKTTFCLQVVRAVTERAPFLDWRPSKEGRALVVDLEQGEATVQARLQEAGLADSDRVDILWEPSGIALDRREEDRAMLRDVLREGDYSVVILDPLYQLHLGSGNDEQVAADTMRYVDGWAREFNVSLVLPMHMRKPHPEAGKSITIHDIAGVGTWLRNAEFVLGLQLMFAGQSRLHFFKDRIGRGPTIRSFWWMDFAREDGYERNHREDRDRIKRDMVKLLRREEGASRDELADVDGSDDVLVQEALRGKHRNGDRYRARKWPSGTMVADSQESLIE